MKKSVFILVMCFCTILLTSCIDQSKELQERIENNERLTEPSDDGTIKDTDPDDDGEG
ncbi:hypothetical protein [Tenacibaculum amylolyticum]|uniref:hypothetical protein n=1 Tax=Tenacibaculum amylolyticum TaxID=104269 RepID=UPI0038950A47